MSRLLKSLEPISEYKDKSYTGSLEEYVAKLRVTSTVYVGNLAFHTSEEQIHELFSSCGPLRRIVMGLDRNALTPCGFCFVEYCTRSGAEDCVKYLCGTTLDERVVRIDFDWGFAEGRQFGRGKSGGQVREEVRQDYDSGRGGLGKGMQEQVAAEMGYGSAAAGGVLNQKRGREGDAGPFVKQPQRVYREWDNPRHARELRDDGQ